MSFFEIPLPPKNNHQRKTILETNIESNQQEMVIQAHWWWGLYRIVVGISSLNCQESTKKFKELYLFKA